MKSSSTNLSPVYAFSSFTNKIFHQCNSNSRNPDLTCCWKLGKLNYTLEQSVIKIISCLFQKRACEFLSTANESIPKISLWSAVRLSFIFLLVSPLPPAKMENFKNVALHYKIQLMFYQSVFGLSKLSTYLAAEHSWENTSQVRIDKLVPDTFKP